MKDREVLNWPERIVEPVVAPSWAVLMQCGADTSASEAQKPLLHPPLLRVVPLFVVLSPMSTNDSGRCVRARVDIANRKRVCRKSCIFGKGHLIWCDNMVGDVNLYCRGAYACS